MIIFPGGVQQKWNFQGLVVGGGGTFCELILEIPEEIGGHRKNPFCGGGGVCIFSGTAHCDVAHTHEIDRASKEIP